VALHLGQVAVNVDRLAAFLRELDGQLERKPVRRREREGLLARDRARARQLLEQAKAALQRLPEPLLLRPDRPLDLRQPLAELRVGVLHLTGDDPRNWIDPR
jgi:hypothetical protein